MEDRLAKFMNSDLHGRTLCSYLSGALSSGVAHLVDLLEDSIQLQPLHLIGIGSFVALLILSVPSRGVPLRDELLVFRSRMAEMFEEAFGHPPVPPAGRWLAVAAPALVDRALAGERIDVADVDQLIEAALAARAYRLESAGVDAIAENRTYWLELLTRWRADLLARAGHDDGHVIAVRRKALGWSQKHLAEAVGVDPQTVSRWERHLDEPLPQNRRRLADLLGGRPVDYAYP